MGKEYACIVRVDGRAETAKLHLDSHALQISGARRLTLPLPDLRDVVVDADRLRLRSPHGVIELELGAKRALAWRSAIVSPKTLIEKIGLRPGDRVVLKNLDVRDFARDVARIIGAAPATTLRGTFDAIFLGVDVPADLAAIARAARHVDDRGALWIIHPKGKGAAVPESAVRAAVASSGMYDAKVVAFSAERTAMRAMFRLVDRARR